METIVQYFGDSAAGPCTEEQRLAAYDRLCAALRNIKHEDAVRRWLQNPAAVAQVAARILEDTRTYPGPAGAAQKPPVLTRALKTLGFFLHNASLAALLADGASAAVCARLCAVLRECTSRSTLHMAVWCVTVETLRKRPQSWAYFRAIAAMLGSTRRTLGSSQVSSQGASGTQPTPTPTSQQTDTETAASGTASTGTTTTAGTTATEAATEGLDADALRAMAVLVPMAREDIARCTGEEAGEWAPPVHARLVAESARVRDCAAQVANALLVHVVPLPPALTACFARDVRDADLLARFRHVFLEDSTAGDSDSDAARVGAGTAVWGTMAGLLGDRLLACAEGRELLALGRTFFAHASAAVRAAAFSCWSFVAQTVARLSTQGRGRGEGQDAYMDADADGDAEAHTALVMEPFLHMLDAGETAGDVLTSAFRCWMAFVMKLDVARLVAAFGGVVAAFVQRLCAADAVSDFFVAQLCTLFDGMVGFTDSRTLPQTALTVQWLGAHCPALCAPFHIALRRTGASAQCLALVPTTLSFIESLARRIAACCNAENQAPDSALAECMKCFTSLTVAFIQKQGTTGTAETDVQRVATLLFSCLSGSCVDAQFKLNVESPSGAMQCTFYNHILSQVLDIFLTGLEKGDGGCADITALANLFQRSMDHDVQEGDGTALAVVTAALSRHRVAEEEGGSEGLCTAWTTFAEIAADSVTKTSTRLASNDRLSATVAAFLLVPFSSFPRAFATREQSTSSWERLALVFAKIFSGTFLDSLVDETSEGLKRLSSDSADHAFLRVFPSLLRSVSWKLDEGSPAASGTPVNQTNMKMLRELSWLMSRARAADKGSADDVAECVQLVFGALSPESLPAVLSELQGEMVHWLTATANTLAPAAQDASFSRAVLAAFQAFSDCVRRSNEESQVANIGLYLPVFECALSSESKEIRAAMVALWNATYGVCTSPALDCPEVLCDMVIDVAEKDQLEVKMIFLEDEAGTQEMKDASGEPSSPQPAAQPAAPEPAASEPAVAATAVKRTAICDPRVDLGPGRVLKGLDDPLSFEEETQPPSARLSRDQEERPAKKPRRSAGTEEEEQEVATAVSTQSTLPPPPCTLEEEHKGEEDKGEKHETPTAGADEVAHALSVLATTLEESAEEWSPEDLVRISRYCERMNSRIVFALSRRLSPSP